MCGVHMCACVYVCVHECMHVYLCVQVCMCVEGIFCVEGDRICYCIVSSGDMICKPVMCRFY